MSPRHVIGIDLGTTHTRARRAPRSASRAAPAPRSSPIPQLVAAGTVEARPLLPSFLYLAHESEGPQALPWDAERRFAVGEHARARGVDAPARLVSSAKSWLSHAGVDRRGPTLPVGAPEDVEKISPVEASWRYLEHLGEAWDERFAGEDPELAFAKQEVVLTVPASFDAVGARAHRRGRRRRRHRGRHPARGAAGRALRLDRRARATAWRKEIQVGDVILVVDVGGGTTDFSAIAALEQDGSLELDARRGRRSHPARRRQHGPRARPRGAAEARRRGQGDRPLADERAHPRLPRRQGAPARRRRRSRPRPSPSPAAARSSSAAASAPS